MSICKENCTYGILEACDPNNRPSVQNTLGAILILVIMLVAMAGNGLVLISLANCNILRQQKGSCFIANLALTDFICSGYVMLPSALFLFNSTWQMSGWTCNIHGTFNSILLSSQNMSLAAISFDRAIAINHPFKYPNLVTTLRVKIAVAYIWLHSFVQVLVVAGYTRFSNVELMCSPVWTSEPKAYYWVSATFSVTFPSTLLLVSNIAIVCAIRRSRSVVFENCPVSDGSGNQLCVKTNTRTLSSLYVLVLVYFSCVTPFYATKVVSALRKKNVVPDGLCLLPTTMLYSAPAINPWIYSILRKDHKKAFIDTLKLIIGKLKRVQMFLCGHPEQECQS